MIFGWACVGALAAYRLAHLVTQERGPFDVFLHLRNLHTDDDWLGHGLRCLYCVSFWLAALMSLLVLSIFPPVAHACLQEFFLVWWGMAGLILPLDRYWRR